MRKELLAQVKRVVIKVGSGVLVGQDGVDPAIIEALVKDLCKVVEQGYEVLLVSSGAVATGKGDLGIVGRPPTIPLKQAAAAIGQSRLMRYYKDAFRTCGRRVAQILLTRDDLANRRRFLNARNTLMTLLEYGIIPIINENDTVVVDEIRFGDNDNLSALVTNLAESDLLVILSDVDGLYDSNPRTNPQARLINKIEHITPEIEGMAGGAGSEVGTGGMATKIEAAKRASLYGVSTVIVNGRQPHVLSRLFAGEELGSWFLPAVDRLNARKHWIAFTKKIRGRLLLDEGAHQALADKGKSLLPSGIIEVEGNFERGDAVRLCDAEGREFARGIINYSQAELVRIQGHNSQDIEELLGYQYGAEVVHRDNLVLKKRAGQRAAICKE
ncbi:glutamate 5-kinase [Syntrophotalea acetylenivorans]|uniref:Glutamate 5-kinase n=1 Tax=Syntrophotalea acetylenivorans TaxID=1842532 RepID=A0A1L3GPF3_9BACT|nr:glutamate 5-kinase [Syntrophotalea acetylenivorans]APG27794.1 glutamate 5-kinase [Syntrophotalea acetylenivorans]